jgi:hypothetical protein
VIRFQNSKSSQAEFFNFFKSKKIHFPWPADLGEVPFTLGWDTITSRSCGSHERPAKIATLDPSGNLSCERMSKDASAISSLFNCLNEGESFF